MKENTRKLLILFLVLANITGCGDVSIQDVMNTSMNTAEVVEMETEATEMKTIKTEEYDASIPYVERYGLEFYEDASAETTGVLCLANQTDDADIIDVTWQLDDIYIIEDGEKQTITIKQHTDGYFWGNGSDVFKTNLMLPSGKIYDSYTGVMISASTDDTAEEISVEWNDKKYAITNVETHEWKNDDWTNWVEDPNGGERLKSTLFVTNTITVDSADYDGLSLMLQPITDFSGSLDGAYIADAWTDECYLFNIGEFAESFKLARLEEASSETEEVEKTEAEEILVEVETKPETKPNTEPKPATPAHKHNYNSAVTKNPTCSSAGVKTFTCSCGDSYTETIGTTAHDFSVPIVDTVWHDEVWQTVPKTVTTKWIYCRTCKNNYYTNEDYQAHLSYCDNWDCYDVCTETKTVYDRVKVSDGYFEESIVGYKCSVCGVVK